MDLTTFDYLVVFGSRTTKAAIGYAKEYGPTLRKAARSGLRLVCIDNTSFLLAAAGLLKGYKVALHWRHIQEFRDAFPLIPVVSEQIYCFDRNRITCAGGATAIDMAVELLAEVFRQEENVYSCVPNLRPRSLTLEIKDQTWCKPSGDKGQFVKRIDLFAYKKLADDMAALSNWTNRSEYAYTVCVECALANICANDLHNLQAVKPDWLLNHGGLIMRWRVRPSACG